FEHALSQGESWPLDLDAFGVPTSRIWQSVLGNYPFSLWQRVTWTQERLGLVLPLLEPRSAEVVARIMGEFMVLAPPKPGVTTSNYRERIRGFMLILQNMRRLPVPPLLLQDGLQFEVLDGNHRLAALFLAPTLKIASDPLQECWVAR